jgi:hypothetical protein
LRGGASAVAGGLLRWPVVFCGGLLHGRWSFAVAFCMGGGLLRWPFKKDHRKKTIGNGQLQRGHGFRRDLSIRAALAIASVYCRNNHPADTPCHNEKT